MPFCETIAARPNMTLRRHLMETCADAQDIGLFWMLLKHSVLRSHVECPKQMVVADAAWKMGTVLPMDVA
jgi:hypothetical protein